jgi:hypothetical protein
MIKIKRNFESDPLSPPEGEASQGENPLDPLHYFFCCKEDFMSNFLGVIVIFTLPTTATLNKHCLK